MNDGGEAHAGIQPSQMKALHCAQLQGGQQERQKESGGLCRTPYHSGGIWPPCLPHVCGRRDHTPCALKGSPGLLSQPLCFRPLERQFLVCPGVGFWCLASAPGTQSLAVERNGSPAWVRGLLHGLWAPGLSDTVLLVHKRCTGTSKAPLSSWRQPPQGPLPCLGRAAWGTVGFWFCSFGWRDMGLL